MVKLDDPCSGRRYLKSGTIAFLTAWLACVCPWSPQAVLGAAPDPEAAARPEPTTRPQADTRPTTATSPSQQIVVEKGFVILDGRYVEPPYRIETEGDRIWINGILVPAEPQRGRFGSGRWRRRGRRSTFIEYLLENNGLVLGFDANECIVTGEGETAPIMRVLLSDDPPADKAERLAGMGRRYTPSRLWKGLIETFQPTDALRKRFAAIELEWQERRKSAERKGSRTEWTSSAIMLAGLVAVVVSVGLLADLHSRSGKELGSCKNWRHQDATGVRSVLVVRMLLLLWGLNILDLLFTLAAQEQGAGFWEMNPLVRWFISNPVWLIVGKLSLVAVGSGILWRLRRYRGAEVGAWWLSLVYVILMFRWLAYNSLALM